MSRPNLGYSNYYWIRQDQRAAKKKQSELKTELSPELSTVESMTSNLEVPLRAAEDFETEGENQDFCDNHGELRDVHAATHVISSETKDNIKDSCDSKHESKHETAASKHETVQESLSLASIVRDGEGKSDVVPSVQPLPRIDSWLPAVVPESDK